MLIPATPSQGGVRHCSNFYHTVRTIRNSSSNCTNQDHICINSLVPIVLKTNIGNPGNQVNYWGGLTPPPPLIYLATWISSIGFLCTWEPANMVNDTGLKVVQLFLLFCPLPTFFLLFPKKILLFLLFCCQMPK